MMDDSKEYQKGRGRALPNQFRRGLANLELGYPGYESDLIVAQEAIDLGLKKEFLKAFRILKGKQIVYEQSQKIKEKSTTIDDLDYPGNEADKRELQTWFQEKPPTQDNVKLFLERIEGLRNKNAATGGDRSHPNIIALLKLKLSYPGCEEDVQEALQVHYSRPITRFPDILHSLKAKQDLYTGNRSHWRLVKLDDLQLTYPEWRTDAEATVDWHIQNSENRENDVVFYQIIDGMLEMESLYLEWKQSNRFSKPVRAKIKSHDFYMDENEGTSKTEDRDDNDPPVEYKNDRLQEKYHIHTREERS